MYTPEVEEVSSVNIIKGYACTVAAGSQDATLFLFDVAIRSKHKRMWSGTLSLLFTCLVSFELWTCNVIQRDANRFMEQQQQQQQQQRRRRRRRRRVVNMNNSNTYFKIYTYKIWNQQEREGAFQQIAHSPKIFSLRFCNTSLALKF
jgi:hypothetical protein